MLLLPLPFHCCCCHRCHHCHYHLLLPPLHTWSLPGTSAAAATATLLLQLLAAATATLLLQLLAAATATLRLQLLAAAAAANAATVATTAYATLHC
jgi:hypothetical protein